MNAPEDHVAEEVEGAVQCLLVHNDYDVVVTIVDLLAKDKRYLNCKDGTLINPTWSICTRTALTFMSTITDDNYGCIIVPQMSLATIEYTQIR